MVYDVGIWREKENNERRDSEEQRERDLKACQTNAAAAAVYFNISNCCLPFFQKEPRSTTTTTTFLCFFFFCLLALGPYLKSDTPFHFSRVSLVSCRPPQVGHFLICREKKTVKVQMKLIKTLFKYFGKLQLLH